MKLRRLTIVALVLLLPILGLLSLIGQKQYALSHASVTRMAITGYDPRDLMYGHYLRFRFLNTAEGRRTFHEYYIPEEYGDRLTSILNAGHKAEIEVRNNDLESNYGMLYIDDLPFSDYLKRNPAR